MVTEKEKAAEKRAKKECARCKMVLAKAEARIAALTVERDQWRADANRQRDRANAGDKHGYARARKELEK